MIVDCQWGRAGAAQDADVAVIVDVISFSTSVAVATERGARIFPFWDDTAQAEALAQIVGAVPAATGRAKDAFSLSPASLMRMAPGDGLVLPSPNGARCSLAAKAKDVLCACLRNAKAVADAAASVGGDVLVVAAGETWPDGSLRVAFEDLIGAGAVISYLGGAPTPEARAAAAAFEAAKPDLRALLMACLSGAALSERGYGEDVELAAQLNVSAVIPMLVQHRARYRDAIPGSELADRRVRYYEDARP
jgi:2-phosphosulfolactate phosphatase